MIFCLKINIKVFYKSILSFLMAKVHNARSTQNNNFVISLQYLKKEGRDEIDIWHRDKHQSFLQAGTTKFGGHGQSWPKHLKKQDCKIFAVFQDWLLAGLMGMFSFIYLSKTIINDYFHLKNEGRDQGSSNIVLFLLLHSSSLSF